MLGTKPAWKRWTATAPLVPDELRAAVEPLRPAERSKPRGGRPRAPDRAALAGILFVPRAGARWRGVPAELGCSGKTCRRRLRDWHAAGVWGRLHRALLERLQGAGASDWGRAALDGASVRARGPARARRTGAVERTLARLARSRRLAVRHERRADVHLALTVLARALIRLRQVGRFCP